MNRWARLAGVFYLITIVAGVFAEVFVRGRLVVRDDAAATATNILTHEALYRSGLVADLIMLLAYVAVTLLLYLLLKPVNEPLSLLAAFFSLIGIAVLAVNCLNHVAPLLLLARDPSSTQSQSLALLALRLHARGYSISGVFFGTYCILIGYLTFKSGFVPRTVGVLMAIGGASYLADSFLLFLLPAVSVRLPDFTMLGGIGELALTLWLIVKGAKVS